METGEFLSELKDGHTRIEDVFKKLRILVEDDDKHDVRAVFESLKDLRDLLVEHIRNEDELFYPALRRRAIELEQEALLPALDLFSESMHDVTRKVSEFFEEYKRNKDVLKDIEGFKADLIDIIEVVEKRIRSEEGSLFYIYRAYFPEKE
ncbi:MAG: hemerythrin domain-containing protein [Thermodesulfobacteriota bacterium]